MKGRCENYQSKAFFENNLNSSLRSFFEFESFPRLNLNDCQKNMTTPKTFVILRGIPGSGKSTKAEELKKEFEGDMMKVKIFSRDKFRMCVLERMVGTTLEELEEAYQNSFRDQTQNEMIKDTFYERVIDSLDDYTNDAIIYDMTNISKDDCFFWFEFVTYAKGKGDEVRIVECEGNYKSKHNVPDNIMDDYRKKWEETKPMWELLKDYIK